MIHTTPHHTTPHHTTPHTAQTTALTTTQCKSHTTPLAYTHHRALPRITTSATTYAHTTLTTTTYACGTYPLVCTSPGFQNKSDVLATVQSLLSVNWLSKTLRLFKYGDDVTVMMEYMNIRALEQSPKLDYHPRKSHPRRHKHRKTWFKMKTPLCSRMIRAKPRIAQTTMPRLVRC